MTNHAPMTVPTRPHGLPPQLARLFAWAFVPASLIVAACGSSAGNAEGAGPALDAGGTHQAGERTSGGSGQSSASATDDGKGGRSDAASSKISSFSGLDAGSEVGTTGVSSMGVPTGGISDGTGGASTGGVSGGAADADGGRDAATAPATAILPDGAAACVATYLRCELGQSCCGDVDCTKNACGGCFAEGVRCGEPGDGPCCNGLSCTADHYCGTDLCSPDGVSCADAGVVCCNDDCNNGVCGG